MRGVTLAELMVACLVLMLVAGMSGASLILVNRFWGIASAEMSTQVNAQVALDRLRRELQESTPSSLTLSEGRLSFLTARDREGRFQTSADGVPAWSAFLIYYLRSSDQALMRLRVAADGAQTLSVEELAALCQGRGAAAAYGISNFALAAQGDQVQLTVTCETGTRGRAHRLSLSTILRVRN